MTTTHTLHILSTDTITSLGRRCAVCRQPVKPKQSPAHRVSIDGDDRAELNGRPAYCHRPCWDRYTTALITNAARTERLADAPRKNTNAPHRHMVKLGSVRVGDALHGHTVTSLGRHWYCDSADDGMTDPWLDGQYVQYAYFG